ncbi:MAG: hypothetical protein KDA61_18400 [Planctomycetales bacterium]|nr:hypothetical protein [Planctomycetales bacterium]
MTLPFPVWLAYTQYRGTFQRRAESARTAGILLSATSGVALFVFAMTCGELVTNGVDIPWKSLLLPMLSFAVFCCVAAQSNFRWTRRLNSDANAGRAAGTPIKASRHDIIATVAMLAGATVVASYLISSATPEYAEHVARDQAPFGLPSDARDVSFCHGPRGTIAYEFGTAEASFVSWVEAGIGSLESSAAHVALRPINGSYGIARYHRLNQKLDGPKSVEILDGLFYEWTKEDRGVYAAYDRKSGRAYYFAHFH